MPPRKRSVEKIAQDAEGSAEGAKVAKTTGSSTTRKRATAKRSTAKRKPAQRKRRADRSTASTKDGGPKKKTGTRRGTSAEIVARNAEIAKLREVDLWLWEEIAEKFGNTVKTVRAGYDSHVAARHLEEASFQEAMKEMRRYVQVLVRDQQALAQIAHDLKVEVIEPEPVAEGEDAPAAGEPKTRTIRHDIRARIAAMHEKVDLMFKEIAIRQAIGDLPTRFAELTSERDWERAHERTMEVLKRHDIPHAVFAEIAAAMDERIDAPVPKTHLSAVNDQ